MDVVLQLHKLLWSVLTDLCLGSSILCGVASVSLLWAGLSHNTTDFSSFCSGLKNQLWVLKEQPTLQGILTPSQERTICSDWKAFQWEERGHCLLHNTLKNSKPLESVHLTEHFDATLPCLEFGSPSKYLGKVSSSYFKKKRIYKRISHFHAPSILREREIGIIQACSFWIFFPSFHPTLAPFLRWGVNSGSTQCVHIQGSLLLTI